MNLYVYCLGDGITSAALEASTGIAGAQPHLIEYQGITAVVSEFAGDSVTVAREDVFAHERVIDCVLAHTTPLPFRFGTVVAPERLESYINSQKNSLHVKLARVRGCVEMSVKVIWDAEAMKRVDKVEDTSERNENPMETKGPGAAFLAAKRREILGNETLKKRADELSSWLTEYLGDVVRESAIRVYPTEALVLAGAYLIERPCSYQYQERLKQAREERSDLRFLTSGPWPPYNFGDLPA